jgi:hypothetical protein
MDQLDGVLRLLAKWRSTALAKTYISLHGPIIGGGPFAGMTYLEGQAEGSLIARLLGTYESELHPHLRRLSADAECIVDIGCAEGYYAVGLARMLPAATVYAYDTSENARSLCRDLAQRNGVADRVVIREEFNPTDFAQFAGRRALIIMDTEGAELDLLRPDLAPDLGSLPLIVETHGVGPDRTIERIRERFEPTHHITRVDQSGKVAEMPDWLMELSHLDQLIAVWEWRHRLTPWLVMEPRRAANP